MSQLPALLRSSAPFPFVGRRHELDLLASLLPRGAGEGRRIALIGGEAGSGKSRLVRELARRAAEGGATVAAGACDAVVRTPYRPFVEAMGGLVRGIDAAELRRLLGPGGGELGRLLNDVRLVVPDLPTSPAGDHDTERHRLHLAVSDLLTAIGRTSPLLLVIEDAHWADAATLQLLRHLGRGAEARMLVVATFRDAEADIPADLGAALADLRRFDDIVRVELAGLTNDEVREFIHRAWHAGEVSPDVHRQIAELTGGNPFLLTELWRTLVETDAFAIVDGRIQLGRSLDAVGTPAGVRDVVRQRITRLGAATRDLLDIAAVSGPESSLEVLRTAAGLEAATLLEGIEEAVASGVLEEADGPGLGHRFTHELVRRAVYDGLSRLRRAELHLRVAEALDGAGAGNLADLAHHYAAAVPLGPAGRAADYHRLAGAAACDGLAFDVAASHLQRALELGVPDEQERAGCYLALGEAQYKAGASADSIAAFREAASIARDLGQGELLALAAIGYENACWRPAIVDGGARELLEEADLALPADDSELRIRLLAGLARALDFVGASEESDRTRAAAVAMARRVGDRRGLATVLMRSYWTSAFKPLTEILAQLEEAARIATELGDFDIRAEADEWQISALMGLGEPAAAQALLETLLARPEIASQPFLLHVAQHYRSALSLAAGRIAEADEAARVSQEWSRHLTGRDAAGVYGIQMFNIRREQGRLAGLAPVVRVLASDRRGTWGPGLAALLGDLGMLEEATAVVGEVLAAGIDRHRGGIWIGTLAYLADAVSATGDRDAAAIVYETLRDQAGTNLMVGHGVALLGSADRYLATLSIALGETDRAIAHFEAALGRNRAMGVHLWTAHTLAEYGHATGNDGLLDEARELAERLDLPRVLARLGPRNAPAATLPDGLSPREAVILKHVASGRSNREIGRTLHISEHTVANHVRAILRKTGCANRTEATAYAFQRDLAG